MLNADFMSREKLESLGFARLGEDVRIHPNCVLVGCGAMSIGDRVRIDPFCVISARESVTIGSDVHISSSVSLVGSGGISIGDFACISHGTRVFSTSDDFSGSMLIGAQVPDDLRSIEMGRVILEAHAILGANVVALPASRLAEGAAVGALSVVRGTLPDWSINVGVPARPIGMRDRAKVLAAAEELAQRRLSAP